MCSYVALSCSSLRLVDSPSRRSSSSLCARSSAMSDALYTGVRNAAAPPDKMKSGSLRACLRCKLIKTLEQFRQEGCDNCGELSGWDTQSYTTPTFKGSGDRRQEREEARVIVIVSLRLRRPLVRV